MNVTHAKRRVAVSASLACLAMSLAARGEAVNGTAYMDGVTVHSFSSEVNRADGIGYRAAANTINGRGLDVLTGVHDRLATNEWMTVGEIAWTANGPRQPDPLPGAYIVYDLGRSRDLSSVHVWNFDEGATHVGNQYGVQGVNIAASATTNFGAGSSYTFAREATNLGDDYAFGAKGVRYVKLTLQSNYGGLLSLVGLAEVRFRESPALADAAQSTISPATARKAADGASTQVITVRARDVQGSNLTGGGATVLLLATAGTMGSTTDAGDGTYTATWTAPGVVGAGFATVTATLNGAAVGTAVGASECRITLAAAAGPADAAHSVISPAAATSPADGTSTQVITVQARDADGVDRATGGDAVAFSATAGRMGAVTDGGDGTYSALWIAPASAGGGVATVTATLDRRRVGTAAGASSCVITLTPVEASRTTQAVVICTMLMNYGTPTGPTGYWNGWNAGGSQPDTILDEETGRRDLRMDFQPPVLYDQKDPAAIGRHMDYADRMGIDAWAAWYFPPLVAGAEINRDNMIVYMDYIEQHGRRARMCAVLDVALFPAGVELGWIETFTPDTVVEHAEYILRDLGSRPSYFRYQGRPVFFMYGVNLLTVSEWSYVLNKIRSDGFEAFFLVELGPELQEGSHYLALLDVFDGGFNLTHIGYGPYTNLNRRAVWTRGVAEANARGSVYMPNPAAGQKTYLWDSDKPWVQEVPRRDGAHFNECWEDVMSSGARWVLLHTWNEWFEHTQLEPAMEYGDLYVDLSREWIRRFKRQAATEIANPWTFPIEGVTVHSSSSEVSQPDAVGYRAAANTVNGKGLDVLTGVHDRRATNGWMTVGTSGWAGNGPRQPDPLPGAYIVYDLGAQYDLHSLHVWNFDEGETHGGNVCSVRDVNIAASATTTFGAGSNYTFTRETTNLGNDYAFSAAGVRYVRFTVQSNYGGALDLTGLAEVRFRAVAPPTGALISVQ